MLSVTRALARTRQLGSPLPPLTQLHDLQEGYFRFVPRGGQQTMICGQPASGKSQFALWWCGQFALLGLPVLYVSADMDQHTATTRLVASVTGETTEAVSRGLAYGAEDYYSELLNDLPVRFMFDPDPTYGDVEDEIDAWVELWDDYPRVIVLDNLLDIVPSAGDNEFSGYKSILLDTKTLARETGAAVLILHHVSEEGTDPRYPAPKKKLLGKVSQTPENILSVAKEGGEFRLSVVKHRNGPDDPTGETWVHFRVFPESNTFAPWTPDVRAPHVYYQAEEAA